MSLALVPMEGVRLQEVMAVMECLHASAFRENNNIQQANRKLERKVKELKMQADEERINLQSQTDQVETCDDIKVLMRKEKRKLMV